jgi:4-alpha-glucanotransferase
MNQALEKLNQSHSKHLWQTIGLRHHHGVNVPIFSLRTKKSGGIGEYLDLLPLVDFCVSVGFDVIQTLPLNDTADDPSPYNAISAFALNPLFISLHALEKIEQTTALQKLKELNAAQRVDYAQVRRLKKEILKGYFAKHFDSIQSSESFKQFESSRFWLQGYALFKVLKEHYNGVSWEDWPEEVKNFSEQAYKAFLITYKKEINYHKFIQFVCHQQLSQAKQYAESQGVFLKGDIPILLNRDSADVWLHRNLFNLDYSAGAPPDQYSASGQNWGFPLYDWQEMEEQNFSWWRWRLWNAAHYFHLYRIDHIVGFFRIWAIARKKNAKSGFFIPENSEEWIPTGEKILKMMLETCFLLPIGEDLGTVPTEVRKTMADLGICGTKVMRWERYWEEDSSFIPLDKYPQESMTTVSTHDSETLLGWWQEQEKEAKAFCKEKGWTYSKELSHEKYTEILRASHHTSSLFHINLIGEYLAAFPDLSWASSKEERINIPGTTGKQNWSYRIRPTLEEVSEHEGLAHLVQSCLSK